MNFFIYLPHLFTADFFLILIYSLSLCCVFLHVHITSPRMSVQ